MGDNSLYSYIINSFDDNGILPKDFGLPKEKGDGDIVFADGALDGICFYHSSGENVLSDDKAKLLKAFIKLASVGMKEEAMVKLSKLMEDMRAISIIDNIQNYIYDNASDLDVNNVVNFAIHLMIDSDRTEYVKIGMIILELVDIYDNEKIKNIIFNLGKSDEFTLFAIYIMRSWPTASKDILELAKQVYGWGRIHCVYYIEPESEEIKDWLVENGVDNSILPNYSALQVYEKSDVVSKLNSDSLTSKQVSGILNIVDALIQEDPMAGISMVEDAKDVVELVINKAANLDSFTENETICLENIKNWYEKTA